MPARLLTTLTLVIILASCRSIKPEDPSLSAIQEPEVTFEDATSFIHIPIKVNLTPLYEQIEKNVPLKLNSTGYPNWQQDANCNLRYKWNFWREKLTFSPNNNALTIHCIGYYQGEGQARPCCWDWCPFVGTGCGINEPPRQIQMGITSAISVTPSYTINASTTLTKLLPINRCRVTTLNLDITDKLMEQVRPPIEKACKDFDNTTARINLQGPVKQVWDVLHTPMPIDTFGHLVFAPTALLLGPLITKGNTLTFSLGVYAAPKFLLNKTNYPAPPALPALDTKFPPAIVEREGFYDVNLDTRLHYAELSRIVNAQMQGMKFDYGKKQIEILEVQLGDMGNRKLLIKVNFKGSVKGWMYLTGTPQFDTLTQELTLPDLDFDIKTRNVLLKSAKWLFSTKLTNTLKEKARFSIAPMLANLKTQVIQNLNKNQGNGIITKGTVQKITIGNIFSAADYLDVTLQISGDLDVEINALK